MFYSFFAKKKSISAQMAKQYLDEALVTSIGNHFVVNLIGYNDKNSFSELYINKYSEVLLTLIREYLLKNKKMDSPFLERAVQIFERTFLYAPHTYDPLIFSAPIFSDFSEFEIAEQISSFFYTGKTGFFTVSKDILSLIQKSYGPLVFVFIIKNSKYIPGITLPHQKDYLFIAKNKEQLFINI